MTRSIFKSRRRRPPIAVAVPRLLPGKVYEQRVWHRHDCPKPRGGECICKPHEIETEIRPVVDPEEN